MIITDKKMFGYLVTYVVCALSLAGLFAALGSYNLIVTVICLVFAVWVGKWIPLCVEFPKKKQPHD